MTRNRGSIFMIAGLLLCWWGGAGFGLLGSKAKTSTRVLAGEIPLAVINGTVIDGTGAPPLEDGVVLIRGNRIVAVGLRSRVPIPPEARQIDARGGTILPGLIDSHVHNAFDPATRRKFIRAGITSVCDLGSPLSRMTEFGPARDGERPVARGFKAGPIFTAPGGLPDIVLKENLNYETASPLTAREGVRDIARRGADVIKVYLHPSTGGRSYPMLDKETLRAIILEAHSRRLIVRAHVTQIDVLPLALETGVDVVDHVPRPEYSKERLTREIGDGAEPMKKLYALFKIPEYDVLLPRLAERKTAVVTTLAVLIGDFLDPKKSSAPQRTIARAILDILRQFHDLGGVIALGTDYNANGKREPAELYFRETDFLLAAGLTMLETIAAATGNAAAVSGHGDDLGTLVPGKLADILIVQGNPLRDTKALQNIEAVVQDGAIVHQR